MGKGGKGYSHCREKKREDLFQIRRQFLGGGVSGVLKRISLPAKELPKEEKHATQSKKEKRLLLAFGKKARELEKGRERMDRPEKEKTPN